MKTPLEILANTRPGTCEATYQAFYPVCQAGPFAANETVERVEAIFHGCDDPVLKSYCFLFLGAVVDSGELTGKARKNITGFLISELNSLTEYALKDDQGRYIHYLSHMAYLAGSLQQCEETSAITEALLTAYLRADEQIRGGEDVVIAEVLLGAVDVGDMLDRLTRQRPDRKARASVIIEANKKALWMAMFVLNGALKKQDAALFAPLVKDLVSTVLD